MRVHGAQRRTAVPARRGFAAIGPSLLLVALVTTTMVQPACPACGAPVTVRLFTYRCTYAPCAPEPVEAADLGTYRVSYARGGAAYAPCDGLSCGGGNGGCGEGEAGQYAIKVERDGQVWSGTAQVPEDVCTGGGLTVDIVVAPEPPPARCLPLIANRTPRAGTFTWSVGEERGAASYPDAPGPAQVLLAAIGRDDDPTAEPRLEAKIYAGVTSQDWTFGDQLALGELRTLAPGEPVTLDRDSVFLTLSHPCTTDICMAFGSQSGARVEVLEAAGSLAPWPTVVTPDFRRVLRLTIAAPDAVADAVQLTRCDGCEGVLGLALDVTFEVTASDVALQDDGSCRLE